MANIAKQVNNLIYLTRYGNLYWYLQQLSSRSNEYPCDHEQADIFIATYLNKHSYQYN